MESGEWTWGELLGRIEGVREEERRRLQGQALTARGEALLLGRLLAGERLPELYEAFPFWNEEEVNEMKVAKVRRIMERQAGGHG